MLGPCKGIQSKVIDNRKNLILINLFPILATTGDELTDTLFSGNMFLLFIAGIETSSITLSCCLYELALNPDVQNKARQEIRNVTQNSELNLDVVSNQLPYLDMIISGK